MPLAKRFRYALAVILATIAFGGSARGADRSLEYAVKATFLTKFPAFVDWPQGAFVSDSSPFILCVAGSDPYGGRIEESARGQSVGRRPIVVRALAPSDARTGCHLVFVGRSERQATEKMLQEMTGAPLLTVTDSALGPVAGVIHFVIVDDRVSFDIDDVAAARNRLTISSKLLALARRVKTRSERAR